MKKESKKPRRGESKEQQRQRRLKTSFEIVYVSYLEAASVDGTWSCEKFYRRISGADASNSRNQIGVVTVSPQDFLSDVELAAKAILNQKELVEFKAGVVSEANKEKVGREFTRRKIHPLHVYLAPKDLRRKPHATKF